MERGSFREARARFGEVASRCESGDRGRSALLLLSTVALDVRNPWADPDRAAHLAAAYLKLPDAPPAELSVARTLYLLALDRGAAPVGSDPDPTVEDGSGGEGDPAARSPASRFSNCSGGGVVERIRPLPTHPGTRTSDRLNAVAAQRDSLRLRADSLAAVLEATRAELQKLEAELERIRELLKGGGGDPDTIER
jgi:hypothetical protein